MSKVYSSKALPAGTVLREWRLEEVLGVGGFGIVYKGRGIYFGELVAIKEYFPSSISERNEDDTVVPVDSSSEEVHALGLKKFVEEAKLLWNLSTPTRHPNIVSVRSLFEVHGTAYMVMDFEDGVSLSKMLKRGDRFNEASLSNLVKPIAEGLERAHRVGVLHRDIKPPNILVTEGGRPVLIDFGSARFESADATSTKVTFHTPPYAAIEQYVKTYEQGPWTDIYALGVVLYECVTGQKPADVLERLHGGDEMRLADGNWPGYSKTFLAAIDAAMIIKPSERPQSIAEWMAMFDGAAASASRGAGVEDDEATRVAAFADAPDEIMPVAPPLPGFSPTEKPPTSVPDDPKDAKFRRVGEDSAASVVSDVPLPERGNEAPASETVQSDKVTKGKGDGAAQASGNKDAPQNRQLRRLALGGGLAVAVLGAGGASWVLFGGERAATIDSALVESQGDGSLSASAGALDIEEIARSFGQLVAEARNAGAPEAAVNGLAAANEQLARLLVAPGEPASGSPGAEPRASASALVLPATSEFIAALSGDAERRGRRLASDVPWADPANAGSASQEPANRQAIARRLRVSTAGLRALPEDPAGAAEAIVAAKQALGHWQGFVSASAAARRDGGAPVATAEALPSDQATTSDASPTPEAQVAATGVSRAKRQQFDSVMSEAREIARQVIRLGSRDRPGSRATEEEREGYRIRQADRDTARQYDDYLDGLRSSIRRAKSDSEADGLIQQALQTRDYLQVLLTRSSGTLD